MLAAHAAIALTNARLYERSRELTLLEERHRVARELHDAVAQKLFSLRLLTARPPPRWCAATPPRPRPSWPRCSRLAAQATDELGQIVAELRPRELADSGWPRRCGGGWRCSTGCTTRRVRFVSVAADQAARQGRRRSCCAWRRRHCTTRCATPGRRSVEVSPWQHRRPGRLRGRGRRRRLRPRRRRRPSRARLHARARRPVNGTLDVRSTPGDGTTVTWWCRVTERIRVLIADDHEMVRRGLRTFLSNCTTTSRSSARRPTARSACRRPLATPRPDVVLLDLKMPGEDGVATCRRSRPASPQRCWW